mgnify:CR=1 FL=1
MFNSSSRRLGRLEFLLHATEISGKLEKSMRQSTRYRNNIVESEEFLALGPLSLLSRETFQPSRYIYQRILQ